MRDPFDPSQPVDTLLTITVRHIAPDTILFVLDGEIDLAAGPEFQEKLTKALHDAPSHLVIDLTGVELGSAGLQILTELHATQQAAGYHVALVVDDNRVVIRPLQITALDQVLDLHAEQATAMEACRASL